MTWKYLGASVIGTSHLSRSTPCQDAFRLVSFGNSNEWLGLCLADGAGSAAHSDIGAQIACEHLLRQIVNLPLDLAAFDASIKQVFSEVRQIVIDKSGELNVSPRELASTALVAVLGPSCAAFAQIGDGVIVVEDETGFHTVFWPDTGEYANATYFLTDEHFRDHIVTSTINTGVRSAAIMSDGLQRLALDFSIRAPHPEFFRPLFQTVRNAPETSLLQTPLELFLGSKQVNQRTDDDKTLAIAVRSDDDSSIS
ncbi:MAG: PP2C family serine/threonine-protein phosphatase [Gemmatales bacterium]